MTKLPKQPVITGVMQIRIRELFKEALHELNLFKTCLNCKSFDEPSEICSKFNARPPARVITFGCEAFDEEE